MSALIARCYYLVLRLHREFYVRFLKHDKTKSAQVRVISYSIYNGHHLNTFGVSCISLSCK